MKNRVIEDTKRAYHSVETPPEIAEAILNGLERGRNEMTKINKNKNIVLKAIASFMVAVTVLTTAINVSPAFASNLEKIPFVGKIVQVLQFRDHVATGGTLTDGSDLSHIEVVTGEESEEIRIKFSNDSLDQTNVGSYTVRKADYPNTLTFEIGGTRRFTAFEDFSVLKESAYVKDIYPLITLDDSLIRFVVVFNTVVDAEVVEVEDPAGFIIQLSKKVYADNQPIFSVRTKSYERNETFGIMEENLSSQYETRVLKDEEGTFIIEMGQFETEEAAQELVETLTVDFDESFIIEERQENDIPNQIQ